MLAATTPSERSSSITSLTAFVAWPVRLRSTHPGSDEGEAEADLGGRQLLLVARLLDLSFLWRRDRFRIWRPAARASIDRLRQEVEARVRRLSSPSRLHRCGGALQRRLVDAQYDRELRLHLPSRQRGRLRYLPPKPGHPSSRLRTPEPADCSGG